MSIENVVQEKYGNVAKSSLSNADKGVRAVAEAFGYSADELNAIPKEANMGLSCGNPTAIASLKQGEIVVDLGSGGGLDVFLASKKVGPTGRAIGIDMTPEMIARAQKNAAEGGYTNVEFHQASIDKLPLKDASVNCIISNCVINLASDKNAVFREMFRVAKPGGRVAVSDIALKKDLPPDLAKDIMAYVGCIAGAILIGDYVAGLKTAGFSDVQVVDSGADLNAYAQIEGGAGCCSSAMDESTSGALKIQSCCQAPSGCCDDTSQTVHEGLSSLLSKHNVNDYAASVKVFALKP